MGQPKTIYLISGRPEYALKKGSSLDEITEGLRTGKIEGLQTGDHSGISIQFVKSTRMLYVTGWYDSFVGIEGAAINFDVFCELLGIEQKSTQGKKQRRRKNGEGKAAK